jgi:hypothetical protein
MKMAVFWLVAPRSVIEVCRRFRGACYLHHQGEVSTTPKTAIFVVRISRKCHRTPTSNTGDSKHVPEAVPFTSSANCCIYLNVTFSFSSYHMDGGQNFALILT